MVVLRISSTLNAVRAARTRAAPRACRTLVTTPRFQAQGYGDGKGGPKAENPQEQPSSRGAQEDSEHPGPPAPDVGQKANTASTKSGLSQSMKEAASKEDTSGSPEQSSAQSGGSRSKEATETGGSPTGGEIANAGTQQGGEALKGPQGKDKPRPKIHNQSVPGAKEGLTEEQKAEVERHNKDFEKRHDRASPAKDDKVDKKFWQGT